MTPAGRLVRLPAGSSPEGIVASHRTGTVAVAMGRPDRIALIDERTLAVRIRPVAGKARHLILDPDGRTVYLPGEDTNTLYAIALPSGRVVRSTTVLRQPHNAAVVGTHLWVADELASAVSILDRRGRVVATVKGPVQPGGVAAAAGTVGAVDVRGARMYFYDATTHRAEGSIPMGAGPTHALPVGGDDVVVADTRGGALLLVDMATRRIVSRLATGGGPYGIATDPTTGEVWATLTQRNQVVHVSSTGGVLRQVGVVPTVQQPNTVAEDPVSRCLYVAGVVTSTVQVVCPTGPRPGG